MRDETYRWTWAHAKFAGPIFTFCFLYTFFVLPRNWYMRAKWFIPDNEIHVDRILQLPDLQRAVFAFFVAFTITATSYLGLMLHLITNLQKPKLPHRHARCDAACSLTSDYTILTTITAAFACIIYLWCLTCFETHTGLTYYFASYLFKSPAGFAKITAGFFSSLLVASYLDPFRMRKVIGIIPPETYPGNGILSLAALSGLGGLSGVGGVAGLVMLDAMQLLYPYIIKHIPLLNSDPFVLVMFGVAGAGGAAPYWRYLLPIAIVAPLGGPVGALALSLLSGEWNRLGTQLSMKIFLRQTYMTCTGLLSAAPFVAFLLQRLFECRMGKLYYDWNAYPLWYSLIVSPAIFLVVADCVYYWTHRSCHMPFMYKHSHSYHHSCRPTTSFAGQAADVFELLFTGLLNAIIPVMLAPMHAQVCLGLYLFNQFWATQLHCYEKFRIGFYIYDCHDHNVHHYYGQKNYNFGLYFQFWDRVCGTYRDKVPNSLSFQLSNTHKLGDLIPDPVDDDAQTTKTTTATATATTTANASAGSGNMIAPIKQD